MKEERSIKAKIYARAIVAIMLITGWCLTAITGLVLWAAPTGPRAGWRVIFLGLTKGDWNQIHFWLGVAVIAVTLIHIVLDWKALRGVIRYLTSANRTPKILE
jgi:cytochrome b subunit of formate dehydrogenase